MSTSKLLSNLINHLRSYNPPAEEVGIQPVGSPSRRSAVLICIFEGEHGELRVFLTKRSAKISTQSEVYLPGGGKAVEGGCDEVQIATRGAKEQIGLDPYLITVVTVMEPFISKNLLRVFPVISILPDRRAFEPVLNPGEIENIFDAPLEMFLKDANRKSEERELFGAKFYVHCFNYEFGSQKFLICDFTASILIRVASVVYQRPPSFPDVYPRPKCPYKDPDDGRQRFLLELEFVQCLANPTYINYLAQNRYFEDEAFIGYLKYLQYWQRPEYIKYIMYPHCLFFLELLQNADFRNAMAHLASRELAHRQQYFYWKHYRHNRMKHILPRSLPEPAPVIPPVSSVPVPSPMPPSAPSSSVAAPATNILPIAPAGAAFIPLPPMQFVGQPVSGVPRNDTRNPVADRRKRK